MRIAPVVALFAALIFFAWGCNEELGPLNAATGFSGVLNFKNWPAPDSVREMRLIVFDAVPTDSAQILPSLLAGHAAIWPAAGKHFPMFLDSVAYEFTTTTGTNLQVKNYEYVAVVFQFGPSVLTDWAIAGVYTEPGTASTPEPLRVLLHRVQPNVDIDIDFHNLPPRPWRK